MAAYRVLLQRAERGEIVGGMHVIAVSGGIDETGIYGEFADQPKYAAATAREALACLLGHALRISKPMRRSRKEAT